MSGMMAFQSHHAFRHFRSCHPPVSLVELLSSFVAQCRWPYGLFPALYQQHAWSILDLHLDATPASGGTLSATGCGGFLSFTPVYQMTYALPV
jgi:hypothetical protein